MSPLKLESTYPLSPMQEGMLLHGLDQKGTYVQQVVCSLREGINVPNFAGAWQRAVERHSILRTGFRWEDLEEPLQDVYEGVQCPFISEDWSGGTPEARETRLESYIRADRQAAFTVTNPPLTRVALFRFAEDDYRAVWTYHHALLDGRSRFLVLKEVFDLYDALCDGRALELPEARPFADYIAWLGEQDQSKARSFWQQRFHGLSEPTMLGERSFETPRELSRDGLHNTSEQVQISEETALQLKALANRCEATLNNVIQASWALLLSRYTGGEEDIVFGATRAGRHWTAEHANSMVGLFINTLPMRVCVQPDQSLMSLVKGLRSQHVELRDFEHTPPNKIQEWSGLPRGRALFNTILVFERFQIGERFRALGGNWNRRTVTLLQRSDSPLVLGVYADSDISLDLEYDRRIFDQPAIRRMLNHLKTLLECMTGNVDRRIGDLSMLSDAERHQLLVEWNDTGVEYPKDQCIHHLFEAQAVGTPGAPALIHGGTHLTYAELNERANALAYRLIALGTGPGVLVGICLERSVAMVVGTLAILKAGGAYVPLDPAHPAERLRAIIADSQPSLIVTQHSFVERVDGQGTRIHCMDSDPAVPVPSNPGNPVSPVTNGDPAYVIYTSGSTGAPKGVLISHGSLVNHCKAVAALYELGPKDRVLQFASISFDVAAEEIFPTLSCGAAIVLPPGLMATSLKSFSEFLRDENVTVVNLPASYWHEWVRALVDCAAFVHETVRLVVTGSERVLPKDFELWQKVVGDRARWLNAYGLTETTITSLVYDPAGSPMSAASGRVPIGRPISNTHVYILDRHLQPVPVGVAGHLYIGGACLALGYLNRPDLTEERFIPHPFATHGGRLCWTGDLARYLPSGEVECLDRVDQQVKIRAHRIELGEIETALAAHAGVRDAVVIAREDPHGDRHLVAYFVRSDDSITPTELRNHLAPTLPDYMIPSMFVELHTIPLTQNGKVDRKALPVPDRPAPSGRGQTYVAPRDELEERLATIWASVLRVPSVGAEDDFFDLGGHSLLGVRLFTQIEEKLGESLPLATLFQASTVRKLADIMRGRTPAEAWRHAVAIQPAGTKDPLFCIHPVGGNVMVYRELALHLGTDQPVYGIQARGIDGRQAPHQDIATMAFDYVREIRRIQPAGPYALAGSSLGGLVAYEVAQQLHAQGQGVALLGLFDTHGPDYKPSTAYDSIQTRIRRAVDRVGLHAYNLVLAKGLSGKVSYIRSKATRFRRQMRLKLTRKESAVQYLVRPGADDGVALPEAIRVVQKETERAAREHVVKPYPGKITLFRAHNQPAGFVPSPTLGWAGYAHGGIDVYEVPGYHGAIVYEPLVGLLAGKLRLALDRARREYATPPHEVETEGVRNFPVT